MKDSVFQPQDCILTLRGGFGPFTIPKGTWSLKTDANSGAALLTACFVDGFATDLLLSRMLNTLKLSRRDRTFFLVFEQGGDQYRKRERKVLLRNANSLGRNSIIHLVCFEFSGWQDADDISVVWSHYRNRLNALGAR